MVAARRVQLIKGRFGWCAASVRSAGRPDGQGDERRRNGWHGRTPVERRSPDWPGRRGTPAPRGARGRAGRVAVYRRWSVPRVLRASRARRPDRSASTDGDLQARADLPAPATPLRRCAVVTRVGWSTVRLLGRSSAVGQGAELVIDSMGDPARCGLQRRRSGGGCAASWLINGSGCVRGEYLRGPMGQFQQGHPQQNAPTIPTAAATAGQPAADCVRRPMLSSAIVHVSSDRRPPWQPS